MANGFEKRSPVDCRPSLIRSKIHRKRAQTFSTPPFCTFPRKTCKNVHFREVAGNGVQMVLPLKNVSETLGLLEKNRRNEFADLSLTTWLPRPSRALEQAGGHQSPQAERRAGAPRPCPRSRTDLRFLPAVRVVTPSRLAPRGGVKIGGFEPQDREERDLASGPFSRRTFGGPGGSPRAPATSHHLSVQGADGSQRPHIVPVPKAGMKSTIPASVEFICT